MRKAVYIILGTLSLILGIIGIVVPGLPTTPFLLLTAGLYARSSDKLYNKLISNKILGSYILKYRENKAISLRVKVYSIAIMWVMISLSAFVFISSVTVRIVLFVVGAIGTFVMLRIPTIRDSNK